MKLALLIEDDLPNRKLLRDILEIKFQILDADSAETAAVLLQEHQPDAIFLDMQLPGMDGTTFLRRLKSNAKTASIPVIGISALAFPNDVKNGRENGCIEYVTKPIEEDPYPFVERMDKLIEKHRVRNKASDVKQPMNQIHIGNDGKLGPTVEQSPTFEPNEIA